MIPLGDVVPRRTRPVVTASVAGLLTAAFLVFALVLDPEQRWAAIWTFGASPRTLPWPALLTSVWLEASWPLVLANVGALLLFGPTVEDRLGRVRTALLLGGGAAAQALAAAAGAAPTAMPFVGASSMVAGVAGAYLALVPASKLVFWVPGTGGTSLHEVPAYWGMAAWLTVVAGRLVRFEAGTGVGLPMLTVAAVLVTSGLAGRLLARPERRALEWWDGAQTGRGQTPSL